MAFEIHIRRDSVAVRRILETLPEWFGDRDAIDNYVAAAEDDRVASFVAAQSNVARGVALVRRHFPESAELHLIAIDPGYRHSGIGRALVERVAADLREDGCRQLSVHTVGPSFESEQYAQTRAFYRALGFLPLEEHSNLDWPGPSLILVRHLT